MSKYYIGGVANVSAFQYVDGNLKHFFDAKTLTDSSINVSVSNEEIRGGDGAQLLGKFFHTTVFNLSLTDALFDLNYIAAQVGSSVDATGNTVTMGSYKVTGGKGEISVKDGEISPLQFAEGNAAMIGWDTNGITYNITGGTNGIYTVKNGEAPAPDETCVTVPISKTGNQVRVSSTYAPGIMSLIMRARLFVGDSCKASDGKPVGELVIEIPRFQLDGTIDLAMAMTSPATYALNGSALAYGCGCNGETYYAKITEVIKATDSDPFVGYTGIVIDGNYLEVGQTLGVYAFATGKSPKALTRAQYTVVGQSTTEGTTDDDTIVDANGTILKADTITVTAKVTGSVINGKTDSATLTNDFSGYTSIFIDPTTLEVGKTIGVYASGVNKASKNIPLTYLTIASTPETGVIGDDGVIAGAGAITATVNAGAGIPASLQGKQATGTVAGE